MKILMMILAACIAFSTVAQSLNQHIQKGNDAYKEKNYAEAYQQYSKALGKDAKNAIASYNKGNTLQRMNKPEEATKAYETAAANTNDVNVKARALNNQGLAFVKQKKLPEAIEAFKQSLRLYAFDEEVRENLQKALNELKKQQSSKQNQNNDTSPNMDEDKKKNKSSSMSEEQAEKLLKQLEQDEKDTQKQIRQRNRKDRQLKDW